MLRKRIIPVVLLDGFSVLKTIKFGVRRNLGSPVTVVRTYNTRNVDELVLLDIDASKQGRAIDKFTIQEIARDCFMPLTVGGGIRTIADIRELLNKGADKIAINSQAIKQPRFVSEAAEIFGSQCIVVSVDVIDMADGIRVYNNGGIVENLELFDWLVELERLGAGEILINDVSRDGTMEGANADLAARIADAVSIPVIFTGGVSSPENAAEIAASNISAVGISSIFHFTDATPSDCRQALKKRGIPAR